MRLKPDARDHRIDLRKRGDGVATPIIFIYIYFKIESMSQTTGMS